VTGPLSDIRILTVSEYGAGPITTELFADLGADVIKIESPTLGESGRYVPPYQADDDSLFFQTVNRGKRSIAVDLKTPEGQEVLAALAKTADAVFTNIRPRAARKLGLTYETLKHANPKIVAFLLSGWGRDSPHADRPAYDYAIQAAGGQMDLNAEEGEAPRRSATPWVDTSTSYISAFGMLTAIHDARRTGVGYDAESSMLDTAMAQWMYLSTWHLTRGYEPDRLERSSHPSVVPSQMFALRDGHVMVMCQTQQFWLNLCSALGLEELAADTRYQDLASRRENRRTLIPLLDDVFARMTRDEARDKLEGRVPNEIVRTFAEAMESFRTERAGSIVTVDHPEFGPIQMVGPPIRSDAWQTQARRGPRWGEHTRAVLADVGFEEERIQTLTKEGHIRCE
jgi:crotonobetainyl-CoA:carnitine CoA-transferase CaiB-like acyl-CoA transferase